jgi:ATP-binding cassette subfamily C protein
MIQIHDRVVNSQSTDTLIMLTAIAVFALVLYGILEFVRSLTFQAVASIVLRKLDLPVIEAALTASLGQGTAQAGQAIRDVNDLRSFVTGSAVAAPLEAAWCPLFLGVLFLLHPLYGFVALVSALILIVLGLVTDLMTRRTLRQAGEANLDTVGQIAGTLRHAEAIDAMGMLPALGRRWRAGQAHAWELFDRGTRRGRVVSAMTRSLRAMMQVAVLAVGAVLVIRNDVSPGSMVAASIIMGRLLQPLDTLVDGWRQWVMAGAAWQRVSTLLANQGAARETKPTPATRGPLVVDRLVYAVPGNDIPILKGVNFRLEPGEVLGIIGPSAAGKSTLARLLVGVFKPTSGGVFLSGHNTFLWERESFGDAVGYLPQSIALMDGTLRDNIARMREGDPAAVIEAARRADVHDLIGRLPLGYDTPVGDTGHMLSGGQRQRIALARALYGRPNLIVLDEPNANLDATGEQALLRAIAAAKADGAMVIMIAHRPSIMQVADKLLVLEEGRVAQFGPRTAVVETLDAGKRSGATPLRLAAVAAPRT